MKNVIIIMTAVLGMFGVVYLGTRLIPPAKPHINTWWSEEEVAGKPVTYVQVILPPLPHDIAMNRGWVELLKLDGLTPFARQEVKPMITRAGVVFDGTFPGMHMNLKANFIYELEKDGKKVRISGVRRLTEQEFSVDLPLTNILVPLEDQDRSLERKTAIHTK